MNQIPLEARQAAMRARQAETRRRWLESHPIERRNKRPPLEVRQSEMRQRWQDQDCSEVWQGSTLWDRRLALEEIERYEKWTLSQSRQT